MERDAVVDVHPRGEDDVRDRGPDRVEDVAGQSGAVLEAAAVRAGPVAGTEQFVQQVAVALLDVDEVEADGPGQARGGDVVVDQPLQLVVGDERVSGLIIRFVSLSAMVRGSSSGSCVAMIGRR